MKSKYLFLVYFLFVMQNALAHKNIVVKQTFGNVSLYYSAGYYYEEINKGIIISKYTKILCDTLNYKQPVSLFFQQISVGEKDEPIQTKFQWKKEKNEISILLQDSKFSIQQSLNFIYKALISDKQIFVLGKIDSININNRLINKILSIKITRPTLVKELGVNFNNVSYYFQNNNFYIYRKSQKNTVIDILTNVYFFKEISSLIYLYSNEANSIDYYNLKNNKKYKYNLDIKENNIKPFFIIPLTKDIISITVVPVFNKNQYLFLLNTKSLLLIKC